MKLHRFSADTVTDWAHRVSAIGGRRSLIDLRNAAAHCKRTGSIDLFAELKDPVLTARISC